MIPFIALGALFVGVGVGVAIAVYWEELSKWVKTVYELLPGSFKRDLQGFETFVKRAGKVFKNVLNYYSFNQKTQKWSKITEATEVSEDEIPEHIRNKLKHNTEVETTDEFKEELQLQF